MNEWNREGFRFEKRTKESRSKDTDNKGGKQQVMNEIDKMSKKLLAAQVEDKLMKDILEKPIRIGEKIPNEYELAELYGVGRSTIRETVKSLVSKGVLEVRRGDGTYVIRTDTLEKDPLGLSGHTDKYELALELFEVRLMLEPEIASLAAQKATEEEKQTIQRLCREVEDLYREGKNHAAKDMEFHAAIAKASKNSVVESLIPIIHTAIVTFIHLTYHKLMEETIQTHRAITQAILEGDSVGAKCAMIMHLTYNRQMLLKIMKQGSCEASENPCE